MGAQILDGKAFAADLCRDITLCVTQLAAAHSIVPGLAVVLVGDDPASEVYVRNKVARTREVGMSSYEHRLPETASEEQLLDLIERLNLDEKVDGILVQLPLPRHIDAEKVLLQIDPAKDVDGFHPLNAGLLMIGKGGSVPCTPLGCMLLIKSIKKDLKGLNAVVVGRSSIVGKPVAQLLLAEDCTVTIAHSKSVQLDNICRSADILVAAVGRPEKIRGSWIKPGAIVVDVGINRVVVDGKSKLLGDVEFAQAAERATAITPVPGGVGPMTIACLLSNTLSSAKRRRRLS